MFLIVSLILKNINDFVLAVLTGKL